VDTLLCAVKQQTDSLSRRLGQILIDFYILYYVFKQNLKFENIIATCGVVFGWNKLQHLMTLNVDRVVDLGIN
jgi:hypothetical protein